MQTLFAGGFADDGADIVENGGQVEIGTFELQSAGFDLRKIEDVVDDRQQVATGVVDLVEAFALFGGGAVPAHQMIEAENGVHRRAYFVRHIGQKSAFGAVGPFGGILGRSEFCRARVDQLFKVMAVQVEFGLGAQALAYILQRTIEPVVTGHCRIVFHPGHTVQVAQRTIRVVRIFSEHGHWYVMADDDKSGAIRNFRVDRIESLVRTGKIYNQADVASRLDDDAERGWFGDNLELVSLRVRGDAAWIAEAYPTVSQSSNKDGSIDVSLRITSEHWLARLLLRGGRNVEVLSPEKYVSLAARTAGAIRAKYN